MEKEITLYRRDFKEFDTDGNEPDYFDNILENLGVSVDDESEEIDILVTRLTVAVYQRRH